MLQLLSSSAVRIRRRTRNYAPVHAPCPHIHFRLQYYFIEISYLQNQQNLKPTKFQLTLASNADGIPIICSKILLRKLLITNCSQFIVTPVIRTRAQDENHWTGFTSEFRLLQQLPNPNCYNM